MVSESKETKCNYLGQNKFNSLGLDILWNVLGEFDDLHNLVLQNI